VIATIAYKNAPTCITLIAPQDGKNKDKTSYQKAIAVAKNIKFSSSESIVDIFNSPFFSIKSIPNNLYVAQSIGFTGVQPVIAMMLPSKNIIFSTFATLKFDDIDGYMNYEYDEDNEYSGK
jgi:hypothetical protein